MAYQALADFPLIVSVSQPEEVRHDPARPGASGRFAPAVLLTLAVVVAMYLSARRKLLLDRARLALARSERRARHRARQLEQKRSELELTLEHMNHGILMVGADRKLHVVNRQAVTLLGVPAEGARPNSRYEALLDALDPGEDFVPENAVARRARGDPLRAGWPCRRCSNGSGRTGPFSSCAPTRFPMAASCAPSATSPTAAAPRRASSISPITIR